jgi:hypothetical protein
MSHVVIQGRSPKPKGSKAGAGKWKRRAALALAAALGLMAEASGKPAESEAVAAFPPKIPDSSNPFIVSDPSKLPAPLPPAAEHPKLECVVQSVDFDGSSVVEMTLVGPDFEWQVEPLMEWDSVPPGAGESLAFVNDDNPQVRLSFTLYGAHAFLPQMDTPSLIRYLAGIRLYDPKTFVLVTPFSPDGGGPSGGNFHGCDYVRVDYFFMPPSGKVKDVVEYNDYFINLYGYYMLQMRLSGPLGWLDKVRTGLEFHLRRSERKKGLGLPDATAKAQPADGAAAAKQ